MTVPSDFVPLRERNGIHHQTCPGRCWCGRLSPEALLTWEAVRRLEQHTDIGPGNVGPLLMQVNLRQYEHVIAVLRESGYEVVPCT